MKNKVGKIIFNIVSIFLIVMILLLIINISNNKIIEIGIQTEEKVEAIDEQQTAVNKKITDLKEGEYIKYDTGVTTVGDNGIITCVVLYDSTSLYGVQIISVDTVGEEIRIGDKNNFNKAVEEHNNAITKLNNEAAKYLNRKYAISARCVGSVPNNPNSETKTYYKAKETWAKSISGILKDKDNNCLEDNSQMSKLGIKFIGKSYWLASRGSEAVNNLEKCIIEMVEYKAGFNSFSTAVCGIWAPTTTHGNVKYSGQANYGLRPCFTLKNDIVVTGGDGKSAETAYTINNFDLNEKTEVTVQKIWNDNNNVAEKRPSSIILKVIENETEVKKQEVTSKENWSYTFQLPKYNLDGSEKVYKVDEEAANVNDLYFYTKTINGNVITNTFVVPNEKVNITATKIWNDNNNITGVRPNKVELTLVTNGEETQRKLIVSEENNWSATLKDLNKYDKNGNEIIYTVIEKEVPEHYIKTENGLIVTNTIDYESIMIDVILKKYEEGTTIGIQGAVIEINNEIGDSIKVTTDEKGEALFRVVPGKYKYKEIVAPNGYILNNKIYNFTVSKDGTVIFEDNTNGIIYNKKESQPDNPNIPDTPDTPNIPDTPDIPDKPDIPDTPNTPDKPDIPDTPNTPNKPNDSNTDGKIPGNDTTKKEGKLPQTGETLNFTIIISSLIIICIYNFIKMKNNKEIK